MKKIITDTYEEMSQLAASAIIAVLLKDTYKNISLTSGATPETVYEILKKNIKKNPSLVENTDFYNFDDIYLKGESVGVTQKAMNELLYNDLPVEKAHVHSITPENYKSYDDLIESKGGLDLILIGLGPDGHFCGNMPVGTVFDRKTYKVPILEEYPWYNFLKDMYSYGELPECIYTIGSETIMKAKQVILIINGKHKAQIVHDWLNSPVDPKIPSSILKLHPNLTVIMDQEAANLI